MHTFEIFHCFKWIIIRKNIRMLGAVIISKFPHIEYLSKRRQTETSTTKRSTERNVNKPECRQTETSTNRNVNKPKRRQSETSTFENFSSANLWDILDHYPLQWRHINAMASQITSLTLVYWTVYSGVYQRKYQSSASLAFVVGIHRWPVNSTYRGPVTRKMFPFDDVIMPYQKGQSCIR